MTTTRRNVAAGCVVMLAGLVLFRVAEAKTQRIVNLEVSRFADCPTDEIVRAMVEAANVYATADVSLRWKWFRGSDTVFGALQVLVLSREMGERKIAKDKIGPGVLGTASRTTGRAYIFSHRIADVHSTAPDRAFIMGRVIAHEVGHLLLDQGHAPKGIMSARVNLRPHKLQRFTPEQMALLHEQPAMILASR